eukprot:1380917-Prymnesium_polylepis.1
MVGKAGYHDVVTLGSIQGVARSESMGRVPVSELPRPGVREASSMAALTRRSSSAAKTLLLPYFGRNS